MERITSINCVESCMPKISKFSSQSFFVYFLVFHLYKFSGSGIPSEKIHQSRRPPSKSPVTPATDPCQSTYLFSPPHQHTAYTPGRHTNFSHWAIYIAAELQIRKNKIVAMLLYLDFCGWFGYGWIKYGQDNDICCLLGWLSFTFLLRVGVNVCNTYFQRHTWLSQFINISISRATERINNKITLVLLRWNMKIELEAWNITCVSDQYIEYVQSISYEFRV